jgi:hypothetical protein
MKRRYGMSTSINESMSARIVTRPVHCDEKYRLLDIYRAKAAAHSSAVDDLALRREKISKTEYARLWGLAENARAESEAASRALLQHTREHGC